MTETESRLVRRYEIEHYDGSQRQPRTFTTCAETTLTIHIDGAPFVRMACSGEHMPELITGFLFSCGVINSADDLAGMTFSSRDAACCDAHVRLTAAPAAAPLTLTSALGWSVPLQDRALPRLPRPDRPSWDARRIMRAARTLDEHSEIFHLTGGCHNAALLDRNGLVFFCMDIGRHNAIDTLIGHALRHRLNRRDLMILSSGRIASEIVHKALHAGFPVLASLSRAMAASIDLARACGLTLLGNVRDSGFDIYHDNGCLIL